MKKSVLLGPTAYKITWAGCPRGPLARQRASLCSTVRWSAHAGGYPALHARFSASRSQKQLSPAPFCSLFSLLAQLSRPTRRDRLL